MSSIPTPPEGVVEDDHKFAAWAATVAGELLTEVRARGLEGKELKDAGDQASHELLMAILAASGPTTRCSPRRARTTGPARPPTGCGSSTRSTAPGSSASRRATTGPCTSRCGRATAPAATWSPARWPCPALGTDLRHRPAAGRAAAQREPAPDRGQPHPPAGVRAGARRGARRRAGADGLGRREGDRRWSGRSTPTSTPVASTSGTPRAPVAVARAAGLHTCRIDGSPLVYNQDDVLLPDLVVCRPGARRPDPGVHPPPRRRVILRTFTTVCRRTAASHGELAMGSGSSPWEVRRAREAGPRPWAE